MDPGKNAARCLPADISARLLHVQAQIEAMSLSFKTGFAVVDSAEDVAPPAVTVFTISPSTLHVAADGTHEQASGPRCFGWRCLCFQRGARCAVVVVRFVCACALMFPVVHRVRLHGMALGR